MDRQQLSKKAYHLQLRSKKLADGMRNGNFKSQFKGSGIEFSGVRDYLVGDDIRAIDWNVTARMGKPYVKVFEEMRELDVFLVIDKSFSMYTGSKKQSRLEAAMECASLITMASLQNNFPVGAVIFDGKINFSVPPKNGLNHAMMLLSNFNKVENSGVNGSALDNALTGAEKLLKKSTLIFVISDFRTEGWSNAISRLSLKNDVVALRVCDPLDDELPFLGSVPFIDPETGVKEVLPTTSKRFQKAWKKNNEKNIEDWKQICIRHGAVPFILNTNSDVTSDLVHFFKNRERVK